VGPSVVESMMIPIATPIGVEIANANAYNAHDKRGRFGNMRNSAIPIAIAAKTLCKDTVHRAFHALDFVSAITKPKSKCHPQTQFLLSFN
jgi:hypothetical protein